MKNWRTTTKIAFWALMVAVFSAILTALGFLFNIFGQPQISLGEPKFQYLFEGAFDQSKPEYEVAFPLGWDDSQVSNAKILVLAENPGKKYVGIAYVKIKKSNGEIVDTGEQWADFSNDATKQLRIPLKFSQLFEYAGLDNYIDNIDVSPLTPKLLSGQFKIYVEYAGKVMPGSEQTITVYNTPWVHRTYFDTYEVAPGEKIKAYIEVINFGAESDFSVDTCPYCIVTTSYQIDPAQVTQINGNGWWPTRPGALQAVCSQDQQSALHLKRGERKTVQVELPSNATSEQGFYDYIVFVMKNLPIMNYSGNWIDNLYSRDGRQHSTYVVIGN